EARQIAPVDLRQADAEVPAGRLQGARGRERLAAVAWLSVQRAADDADRVRVQGAFHLDECGSGAWGDQRRAGEQQRQQSLVGHSPPPTGSAGGAGGWRLTQTA